MRWSFPKLPKLGIGMPRPYPDGEREFDRGVKTEFPIGFCEADLITHLMADGFLLDRNSRNWRSATLKRGIVIKILWSVRWCARDGELTGIWRDYGAIAP